MFSFTVIRGMPEEQKHNLNTTKLRPQFLEGNVTAQIVEIRDRSYQTYPRTLSGTNVLTSEKQKPK